MNNKLNIQIKDKKNGRKVRIRNRNILTKELVIVGALGQKNFVQPYKIQRDEESCLHSSCLLPAENGNRTLIKSIPGSVQSRNINLQKKMNCESLYNVQYYIKIRPCFVLENVQM